MLGIEKRRVAKVFARVAAGALRREKSRKNFKRASRAGFSEGNSDGRFLMDCENNLGRQEEGLQPR